MSVWTPTTLEAALAVLASHPGAAVLAGGTDLLVEVNAGHRRPTEVVAVDRIAELRRFHVGEDEVVIGSGVTYSTIQSSAIAAALPALAQAARTVGSPQIRHAGTLGGNLGTCSPAGDPLPVLRALDATVTLATATDRRTLPVGEFMVGVKRTALRPGELIVEVRVPRRRGWQGYAKVGVRNAMVISVAGCCLRVDPATRSVAIALGSVGPTALRCPDSEAWLAERLEGTEGGPPDAALVAELARRVAAESRPIDDHRSTAAYRRHAVGVLAGRLLTRAMS